MKTTYKNPWYLKNRTTSNATFESDAKPIEYKGYLIYERQEFGYPIFDVVKDGSCVAQLAGLNGAKTKIDKILVDNPKILW